MTPPDWHPTSYRNAPQDQSVAYANEAELRAVIAKLGLLPPLVTSWEIEHLREQLAEAEEGKRFILQGGDCAEMFADCQSEIIAAKLKILLQMSLVLVHGAQKPVVRIGRFAGQYAKPRSQAFETRTVDGVEQRLPSYFGEMVNDFAFTEAARTPDPQRLLRAYEHSALTLNFVRSLAASGFADVHRPEQWDLSFASGAKLPDGLRDAYRRTVERIIEALRFMEAMGERSATDISRVELFTSHEGLHLDYESAQTRRVPRRDGYYCLTTHLPWIGERTRRLDGAHIAFFRGIENPVGVKLGPSASASDVVALSKALNPANKPGKLVLITRMGRGKSGLMAPWIRAMRDEGRRALWVCDPMHGNGMTTSLGQKTRDFAAILAELEETMAVHDAERSILGGAHVELTGEDVTECIGGADGLTEHDLAQHYATACDPRLNYRQALELAFAVAQRLRARTS